MSGVSWQSKEPKFLTHLRRPPFECETYRVSFFFPVRCSRCCYGADLSSTLPSVTCCFWKYMRVRIRTDFSFVLFTTLKLCFLTTMLTSVLSAGTFVACRAALCCLLPVKKEHFTELPPRAGRRLRDDGGDVILHAQDRSQRVQGIETWTAWLDCHIPEEAGRKCRYLKRRSNTCDIVCGQETYGRLEHLQFLDVVLESAMWEKCGCFVTGSINAGGSVIPVRKKYLPSCCVVINVHLRPECSIVALRRRLRSASECWPASPRRNRFPHFGTATLMNPMRVVETEHTDFQ